VCSSSSFDIERIWGGVDGTVRGASSFRGEEARTSTENNTAAAPTVPLVWGSDAQQPSRVIGDLYPSMKWWVLEHVREEGQQGLEWPWWASYQVVATPHSRIK